MALFDSILDTIKPLTDAYKDVNEGVSDITGSSLSELVKKYTRVTGESEAKQMATAKAKSEQLKPSLQKLSVSPGNTKWGLEDFANDPAAIEQRWQTILTSFIAPNATKGK